MNSSSSGHSPLLLALRGFFWISVYVLVAVVPLAVTGVAFEGMGRSWITEFSVALGFVALVVFGLQFGLVARFQQVAAPFGMDALIQYHRQIAFVAFGLALAHPVLLFIEDPAKLRLLYFPEAPARARFGVGAVAALLMLAGFSMFRQRLRMRYEIWHVTHGLLAVAVIAFSLAHALAVGFYTAGAWQKALWIALCAGLVGALAWIRIGRPLLRWRRPWRVEEVRAERGSAWSVVVQPEGHAGFRFEPGQFGWLILGRSPFAFTQHPFSFSSSAAEKERVTFTIKSRGDFTSTISRIAPGTRAYIDGPYGLFTLDRHEGPAFVLIAGGVGITPLISMIRTMADRGDVRPVLLFYGNKDWETVTFREELDALKARMNLTVAHVLERAPEGWEGETGFIRPEVIRRHLPEGLERRRYFVCGPPAMMDAMERDLVSLGVPDAHVVTERFEMV